MPILPVPAVLRRPINALRFGRNNQKPSHNLPQQIAASLNHSLVHQRKTLFAYSIGVTPAIVIGAQTVYRFHCHTGRISSSAHSLQIRATVVALGPFEAYLTIDDGGGAVNSNTREFFYDWTSNATQDELITAELTVDADPDTTYECAIVVANTTTPPVSICAHEVLSSASVSTADTDSNDTGEYASKAPIYDASIDKLFTSAHDLWLDNGGAVLCFSDNTDTFESRSSATFANVFDASTSVTSSTKGYNIDVQYCNPRHTDNVRCVFAAYGSNDAVAGGQVRLADSSGALATLSTFSTAGEWKTTTVDLDGTLSNQKIDIQFAGNGTNNFNLGAVTVYMKGA